MTTIILPAGYLPAISLFSAKKDIRYYLNAVAINRGCLVATNGHYCGALPLDSGDTDLIIPTDTVAQVLSGLTAKQKQESEFVLAIPEDQSSALCSLSAGSVVVQFTAIDAVYPDWERFVVKVEEVKPHARFNWEYLALFTKASKILAPGGFAAVDLVPNGINAAQITLVGCPAFRGCVMPMKIK